MHLGKFGKSAKGARGSAIGEKVLAVCVLGVGTQNANVHTTSTFKGARGKRIGWGKRTFHFRAESANMHTASTFKGARGKRIGSGGGNRSDVGTFSFRRFEGVIAATRAPFAIALPWAPFFSNRYDTSTFCQYAYHEHLWGLGSLPRAPFGKKPQ